MLAMTRLNAGATFSVLRLYYVRLCAPWWINLAPPCPHRAAPQSQGGSRFSRNNAREDHAGAPIWSSALRNAEARPDWCRTSPPGCSASWVCPAWPDFPRDVEGVARGDSGWHTHGVEWPLRGNTWLINTSLATHRASFTRGSPGRAGGPMSPPPPTCSAPVGAPRAEFQPPRSCLPVKPCAAPPGSCGSKR
ncbi:hypothetical protein GWK47_004179 [Chionoecetes opilio]|uniref:Uncharacterized protein n=1 Tax=Chionoecetes opilio TaxID=41210 RepID=A0A8J4YHR9_CHIOP|nr:hypothetical protein GWK47_004179 [Chionoecetes opilio]